MPLQWTKEYSVNVKELDEQHKIFINILNNFYNAIYQRNDRGKLGKILLDELMNFANFHFETEEAYFDKFNYEDAEEHKTEHRKIKEKIAEFTKKFEAGEAEITTDLVDFLEDWLVDHLGVQDKKYIKCFNEHGLF